MNYLTKYYILLLSLLVLQERSNIAFSQKDNAVTGYNLHETIWVTSDRHLYLPGESVRFSAILFETDTYLTSSLSKIVRIEIFNEEGKKISGQKFELVKGIISQEIILPLTMKTGWYFIRAYTNWMRNFPSTNNCILPIKVVNPADIGIYLNKATNSLLTVEITPDKKDSDINAATVFAVHTTGPGGEPVAVTGHMVNGKDTVASFNTDLSGWTLVENAGINSGTRILADRFNEDYIKVILKTRNPYLPAMNFTESYGNVAVTVVAGTSKDINNVKLLVHSTGTIFWSEKKPLLSGSAGFPVPTSQLPQGIVQFTLLNEENNILDKRLWINKKFTTTTPELSLKDKSQGHRVINEVKLWIPAESDLSNGSIQLLAAREEPFNPLKTFLPGIPGWPSNCQIPAGLKAREAWLIASSYPDDIIKEFAVDDKGDLKRHLNSETLISDDIENSFNYVPETRGQTINGRVVNTSSSEGVSDIILGLIVLNNNTFLSEKTFNNGRFHFVVPANNENRDLLITFIDRPGDTHIIKPDTEYETSLPPLIVPPFNLTNEEALFLRQLSIDMQIRNIYGIKEPATENSEKEIIRKPAFFGTPDRTVTIDKFIKLPSISELIFELIPNVSVKKNDEIFTINVYGEAEFPSLYKPVVLLDGIPLYEFDKFLGLPPDRLTLVEVKNKIYFHGNTGFAGAVCFYSANRDLAGLGLPEKAQLISAGSVAKNIERSSFFDPSVPENIPQLDNTLLWKPVKGNPQEEIAFTTNDTYGDFSLMVFGYTASGQWVFNSLPFKVGMLNKAD